MIRNIQFGVALATLISLGSDSLAQTSTKNLSINGGTGLSGSLSGTVKAQKLPQSSTGATTAGAQIITDLDLDLDGSGVVPKGGVHNATASTRIVPPNSSINISIPQRSFGGSLSGSIKINAGDNRKKAVVGAIDSGFPRSDGAWDDPGQTDILMQPWCVFDIEFRCRSHRKKIVERVDPN